MRYEPSDDEWTAIKPMLPNKPRGVRRVNDRRVLNGIFWVRRSGAPWRDDADWIREFARQKGAWANNPPKRNRKDPICFSPYLYRARNLVELFFNKIKQCRRIATRCDKLAANYLAFVNLASVRIWLRAHEYTA
jgi:transposase